MLNVKHITKEFQTAGQTVRAVSDATFSVPVRGYRFYLIGKSGERQKHAPSPLRALDKPTSGNIEVPPAM